jgi:hypothetical protein
LEINKHIAMEYHGLIKLPQRDYIERISCSAAAPYLDQVVAQDLFVTNQSSLLIQTEGSQISHYHKDVMASSKMDTYFQLHTFHDYLTCLCQNTFAKSPLHPESEHLPVNDVDEELADQPFTHENDFEETIAWLKYPKPSSPESRRIPPR